MQLSSSIKILVADDDPDILVIISSVISVMGVDPVTASDGIEALRLATESLPDLVVVDYNMPGLNGVEVCQRVKSLPHGEFVPFIMLTARDTIRDKVAALDEGIDDYLTKPFHYEELQARIRSQLRVRELNLRLRENNEKLQAMQERLVAHERQAVVGELAGAAAHQLGQPLSAILLNCFLLETLPPTNPQFKAALQSVKADANRMATLIGKLRSIDAGDKEAYHRSISILALESEELQEK